MPAQRPGRYRPEPAIRGQDRRLREEAPAESRPLRIDRRLLCQESSRLIRGKFASQENPMDEPVAQWRADTPGCANRVHLNIARLIGARPGNVAVVGSATAAFSQALASFDFQPGDVIVTTRNDYISNQLMYLSLAERRGVRVRRARDVQEGGVDPESVRELVK